MAKKVLFIVVPAVILVGLIAFFAIDGSAKKDDAVKTVAVNRSSIVDKAVAVGEIEPKNEIAVKSKISGIVRRVFVEMGDKVKIGDPLFDIAPDPTPIEYAEAKRQVELAEVSFKNVKQEYDRSRSLMEKSLISTQEFESKQAEFEESELRLKLAKEKLALIESGRTEVADRPVDNIIKSTIDGTVLAVQVEVGNPVVPLTSYQAGTELMTLARMDDLIFRGTVDEIDVGKLSENMPAEIQIGALPNEKVTGVVTKISPKAHKQEGATVFEIELAIDSLGKNFLRAGYSANADVIISKRENILVIPERLVTITDTSSTVEVQDSLGNIATRPVETGLSDGINIEIVKGVEEGDLVVERPPREIKPWD